MAVFDTSFHQTPAPEAFLYGLPWSITRISGTPLRFPRHLAPLCVPARPGAARVAGAGERLGDRPPGNGASICAVRNGRSVDTSMGMTPLEGLMMGTRSGDVDFGAMAWIAGETRQTLSDRSG